MTAKKLGDYQSKLKWFDERYGPLPANSVTVRDLRDAQRLLIDETKADGT